MARSVLTPVIPGLTCQVRAALTGQAPAEWAIGAPCQAVYSADGEYYDAAVEAVSEAGNFIVVFEGYGNKEEVGAGITVPVYVYCYISHWPAVAGAATLAHG